MVSEFLRSAFERWGLPQAIRVDNGVPWATQSDVPAALALWLVGLGVRVILNRPRQCTDNAIVERGHGVLANWVEPHHARNLAAFQSQVAEAILMQREHYPALKGKSRLATYPQLTTPMRPFQRHTETGCWQLQRVVNSLRDRLWQRRVDKVGRINFFGSVYSVGRPHAGKTVTLRLDPNHLQWVVESQQGHLLKTFSCRELSLERILAVFGAKRANSPSPLPS